MGSAISKLDTKTSRIELIHKDTEIGTDQQVITRPMSFVYENCQETWKVDLTLFTMQGMLFIVCHATESFVSYVSRPRIRTSLKSASRTELSDRLSCVDEILEKTRLDHVVNAFSALRKENMNKLNVVDIPEALPICC